MKRNLLSRWFAAGICITSLFILGQASALDIVKDGKAVSTIVIPDDADEVATMAAGWVRDYVKKATGAELKIAPEKDNPSGALISVLA